MRRESGAKLPDHVAIIIDGSGRWADQNGVEVQEGHTKGAENFREIAREVFKVGIPNLSIYAVSAENFERSQRELGHILKLIREAVTEEHLAEFQEAGIRIIWMGSEERLDQDTLGALIAAEVATKNNRKGVLVLYVNYNIDEENADAAKDLIVSGLDPDEVNAEVFNNARYRSELSLVDFIVRTGGEQRLSGFPAGYAELYFSDTLWPDFASEDLHKALDEYARRKRSFGRRSA